jgi:A/G-specific adenine glycosylase
MKTGTAQKTFFTETLQYWHQHENFRILPWKKSNDPYKIWLSEIIMQQTRVEQGTPYYERFVKNYPTIFHLANADDEAVFRLWQGLGYYNRCKNLLATARHIAFKRDGKFPEKYEEVLQLKGVGTYTAAAIVSFAFGAPYAVVDGNVQRVLARFFGIDTPIDSTEGKKLFQSLAQELLDKKNPAAHNQSIMDYGAMVCKPTNPLCDECLLNAHCFAYRKNVTTLLPVKAKKIAIKKRFFTYLLFECNDAVWLCKREAKDIWNNLYEPFLLEAKHLLTEKEVRSFLPTQNITNYILQTHEKFTQKLSHQTIETQFYSIRIINKKNVSFSKRGNWVSINDLKTLAFPKTIVSFFDRLGY